MKNNNQPNTEKIHTCSVKASSVSWRYRVKPNLTRCRVH